MPPRHVPHERVDFQDKTLGRDLLKAQQHLTYALGYIGLREIHGRRRFVNQAIDSIGRVNLTTPEPYGLRPREQEVVGLVAIGLSNAEIAKLLHISEPTAKDHLVKAYQKLGVNSRRDVGRIAREHNLHATAGVIDSSYILRILTGYNLNGPLALDPAGEERKLTRPQQVGTALIVVAHGLLLPSSNDQITP